jgi:ankyrin repeat protein
LTARSNVNAIDGNGYTPLILAAKSNSEETLRILIKCRGIEFDKQGELKIDFLLGIIFSQTKREKLHLCGHVNW